MMPCLVQCGSGKDTHPLLTPAGSARPGDCFICKLLDERDRLFLALEAAGELLVEGKAVQAHRCIEQATREGVSVLVRSTPPEGK